MYKHTEKPLHEIYLQQDWPATLKQEVSETRKYTNEEVSWVVHAD